MVGVSRDPGENPGKHKSLLPRQRCKLLICWHVLVPRPNQYQVPSTQFKEVDKDAGGHSHDLPDHWQLWSDRHLHHPQKFSDSVGCINRGEETGNWWTPLVSSGAVITTTSSWNLPLSSARSLHWKCSRLYFLRKLRCFNVCSKLSSNWVFSAAGSFNSVRYKKTRVCPGGGRLHWTTHTLILMFTLFPTGRA